MEYLFRTVDAPLQRLLDAIAEAYGSRCDAERRQLHSQLKSEEAPGARDESLILDLREHCMQADMDHWQVRMEAAGLVGGAGAKLPPRPAACAPLPCGLAAAPNSSPPGPACCSLHTEADSLVQDPGPAFWLLAIARVLQCHSLDVAAGGSVLPRPGRLLPPAGSPGRGGPDCCAS
jgi:hypothetical protein